MITTELGLTFVREGGDWRCRDLPQLRMLASGGYEVAGRTSVFSDLPQAVLEARRVARNAAFSRGTEPSPTD